MSTLLADEVGSLTLTHPVVTAHPFSRAMSGDLVRLQHVAPVGGPVAEIAAVAGLLRMHPPHVLLQVRREGGRVALGQGVHQEAVEAEVEQPL